MPINPLLPDNTKYYSFEKRLTTATASDCISSDGDTRAKYATFVSTYMIVTRTMDM